MEKLRTRMLNGMTSSTRIICRLIFLLVLIGCKDMPRSSQEVSLSTPPLSAGKLPTNEVRHDVRPPRQIVITNTIVVGASYAELARSSPEFDNPSLPFFRSYRT